MTSHKRPMPKLLLTSLIFIFEREFVRIKWILKAPRRVSKLNTMLYFYLLNLFFLECHVAYKRGILYEKFHL